MFGLYIGSVYAIKKLIESASIEDSTRCSADRAFFHTKAKSAKDPKEAKEAKDGKEAEKPDKPAVSKPTVQAPNHGWWLRYFVTDG